MATATVQTDPIVKYFDSLLASYDILVDAVEKANERGSKLTRQFTADVVKGQREAIELGKKFAGQPADYSNFYSTMLEATTEAQGRALTFAQAAYQEAVDAGTDARETMTKLVESNQETGRLAMEAARSFAASNPFTETLTRGFEAVQENLTGRTAAPAAREKAAAKA